LKFVRRDACGILDRLINAILTLGIVNMKWEKALFRADPAVAIPNEGAAKL
jgi:hypothetical protein